MDLPSIVNEREIPELTPPPTKSPKSTIGYLLNLSNVDDTAIPFDINGVRVSTPPPSSPAALLPSTILSPSPTSSPLAPLSPSPVVLETTAVQSTLAAIWPPLNTAVVHSAQPRLPGIDYNVENTWTGQQGKDIDVPPHYLAQKLANYPEYMQESFIVPGKMPRLGSSVQRIKDNTPSWNWACYTTLAFIPNGEATSQVIYEICIQFWQGLKKKCSQSPRPNQTCQATLSRGKNLWSMESTEIDCNGKLRYTGKWRLMNKTGEEKAEMKAGGRKSSSSSSLSSSSLSSLPTSSSLKSPTPDRKRSATSVAESYHVASESQPIKTTLKHQERQREEERTVKDPAAKRARTAAPMPTWISINKPNPVVVKPVRTTFPNSRTPGIGRRTKPFETKATIVKPQTTSLPNASTSAEPQKSTAPFASMYDAITLDEDMRSIGRGKAAKKTKPVKTVEPKVTKTDTRGYPIPADLESPYYDGQCGLTNDHFLMWQARFEVSNPDPYGISLGEQRNVESGKRNGQEYLIFEKRDPMVPRDCNDHHGLLYHSKLALTTAFLDGTLQETLNKIVSASFPLGPSLQEMYHDKISGQTALVSKRIHDKTFPAS